MPKKVIIMRGISGAGKSTYVKENFPEALVVSADDYFYDDDGVYQFDFDLLGEAHRQCKNRFLKAVQQDQVPLVVVDNTNCNLWELAVYEALAELFGYEVEIISIVISWKIALDRSKHDIDRSRLIDQYVAFQSCSRNLPPRFQAVHRQIKAQI